MLASLPAMGSRDCRGRVWTVKSSQQLSAVVIVSGKGKKVCSREDMKGRDAQKRGASELLVSEYCPLFNALDEV